MTFLPCETYYGEYRTRTFNDIFPTFEDFLIAYSSNKYGTFRDEQFVLGGGQYLQTVYYLLYARYGNSHIAFSDENQFCANVMAIIWQYGPTWLKRIDVQKDLRALTEEELMAGSRAIYNHSYNPNSAPATSTLEELLTINDQNTTNYKRSKLEAYANLMALLETDVTEEFIGKFRKLFIKVLAFDTPLLYESEDY